MENREAGARRKVFIFYLQMLFKMTLVKVSEYRKSKSGISLPATYEIEGTHIEFDIFPNFNNQNNYAISFPTKLSWPAALEVFKYIAGEDPEGLIKEPVFTYVGMGGVERPRGKPLVARVFKLKEEPKEETAASLDTLDSLISIHAIGRSEIECAKEIPLNPLDMESTVQIYMHMGPVPEDRFYPLDTDASAIWQNTKKLEFLMLQLYDKWFHWNYDLIRELGLVPVVEGDKTVYKPGGEFKGIPSFIIRSFVDSLPSYLSEVLRRCGVNIPNNIMDSALAQFELELAKPLKRPPTV